MVTIPEFGLTPSLDGGLTGKPTVHLFSAGNNPSSPVKSPCVAGV